MVLSRIQKTAVMTHILEIVLDQDPDSNIHKALATNDITSPHDLSMMDEDDINDLEYPTSTAGVTKVLSKGNRGLLKAFKGYVTHQATIGSPIDDNSWLSITREDFDAFRISPSFTLRTTPAFTPCPVAQPVADLV